MVEGVCATRPVDAAAALLQGSPLCLNAMMCVWLAVVKEANTQCELAVFLDDRTMWIQGGGAQYRVCAGQCKLGP